jgi:N-acyl homoserine lactone hydrolase
VNSTAVQRLYLMQLSMTNIPIAPDRTLSMVNGCYLIETSDGKHILIDSGMPADMQSPQKSPPVEQSKSVIEHLADLHLRPDMIDIVISSHFDIDHIGYHDSFTQSEFIVQREHYELARSGHPRFAVGREHWDHPALQYRLIEGDTELLPGLTLIETSGHAPGHQSVLVHLPQTGPMLLTIDAVLLQSMFIPDRHATPNDDNEEKLRASTLKLLDLVEREKVTLVIFGHDGSQWQGLKRSPDCYE